LAVQCIRKRNGAPEEIRTPDPQIRRQSRVDVSAGNSCKIDEKALKSNQCVTEGFANQQNPGFAALQPAVHEAAMWLHLNAGMISGTAIVTARRRFSLTVMEAAEAAKIAQKLNAGGAQ